MADREDGARRGLAWWRPRGGRSAPSPAVLLVSSRHRLWQRYGADGVFAIERAVGDLVLAMSQGGLYGTVLYVDDSPLLARLGVLPADVADPASVARAIRGVAGRMAWLDEDARYVLLLGDDGIVPFHRVPNPSPDGEGDLLCDHGYGTEPESGLRPARAVGRIPDAGLGRFLEAIRSAAHAHACLAAGMSPKSEYGAFGYSASVWKRAARSVFRTVGDPRQVRLSPPLADNELPPAGLAAGRFRYFNLHGLPDSPNWFGQRDPAFPADYPFFPVALRPDDLGDSPGGVVFSEACYGARVQERSLAASLAHMSLARGALAFVGATGVAYGGLDEPLVAADRLAAEFWDEMLHGAAAGDALAAAKWRVVADALERQGYLDAEDEKTVQSFVLYGDPSLVHHPPAARATTGGDGASASGAVERAGPADPVGSLPVQPHGSIGNRQGVELTEHVRRIVARRLPEFATGEVRVVADRGRNVMAAKTAGHSTHTMVVTLCKALPTCDGACYRQFVRVTVDAAGRVCKLTLTR
jgi:hypothetical protein